MSNKLSSAAKLMKSKMYVLITERETIVESDFAGFDGIMQLHTLKMLERNIAKAVKQIQKQMEKENGRNKALRKKRSPVEQQTRSSRK
jgi:cell division protein ZapA (FtsZ GTPase activity inhibitor)